MLKSSKLWRRVFAMLLASMVLAFAAATMYAQDEGTEEGATEEVAVEEEAAVEELPLQPEEVQARLDAVWILLAGVLVFFMQAGFAMLEAGFIRQTGVVNSLTENFLDAALTGILFFAIGYGISYGDTSGGLFGTSLFFLGGADGTAGTLEEGALFVGFFFQFAFAATAATIATGAMAERTNFVGKIIYTAALAVFIYPVVVHWIWQGEGWLTNMGFLDFAGSTVVHQVGGVFALVGVMMMGKPRMGVSSETPPRPHNLSLAMLGTLILWFGWYGFNVGSTLDATNPSAIGLTATNTTLAACGGALAALFFVYFRTGKWDLAYMCNGALGGLVGITAGCAFVAPTASIIIGLSAGIVVVVSMDLVMRAGLDDAVGAFAVHGACGMLGTLAIGLWGLEPLVGENYGLFVGGGLSLFITQLIGVLAVTAWTVVMGVITFGIIGAIGMLRIPEKGEEMGIDMYEHEASLWPDVLPHPHD